METPLNHLQPSGNTIAPKQRISTLLSINEEDSATSTTQSQSVMMSSSHTLHSQRTSSKVLLRCLEIAKGAVASPADLSRQRRLIPAKTNAPEENYRTHTISGPHAPIENQQHKLLKT